ncbi:MAG: DUF1501 domain-containing protein [Candidatus Methylacidiphilales bacterium]|nr:DUF1501 domain-containing protein [Candidatus Methylacidiphilales bacterium]
MKMTRRYFLQASGLAAAYCGFAPHLSLGHAALPENQIAPVTRKKTLVTIFLRGGMDGLNFIVPFGDPNYYALRGTIAVPQPGTSGGGLKTGSALDLDGFFGLHPSASSLMPLFKSGKAAALQAVGYDRNTRSHFEEQDTWETGMIGNTIASDGWLNRHLVTSKGNGIIRAVALGDTLPRILRGQASAFAVRGITDLAMPGGLPPEAQKVMGAALEHAYKVDPKSAQPHARQLLADSATTTMEGIEQIKKVTQREYKPAAVYPKSKLGKQLEDVARLIKADIGLEVAEIDYGGWDTHQNELASYGNLVQGLAEAVAAFCQDLENHLDDVLLLTLSDFGRTAAENGTGGTDHGWANCMLAIGGPARKATGGSLKPVLGKWPTLAREKLYEKRDLAHTTDFRDVLGEVVSVHLGNNNLKSVLPGHTFKPVGLVAA